VLAAAVALPEIVVDDVFEGEPIVDGVPVVVEEEEVVLETVALNDGISVMVAVSVKLLLGEGDPVTD
jgi:hypothetical protein